MTKAEIGLYGLGTMGSALALNLAQRGFRVATCNYEAERIPVFLREAGDLAENLTGHETLESFVEALRAPRLILFMIPSGAPLDGMLARIMPLLQPGDTVIDAGNADFNATVARSERLSAKGIDYLGVGVSGGETGARHGPSMMVGGPDRAWARFQPMAEAIAARFQDVPCVAHLGPDGAGHFVKTVHNGIEYADMQMLAEAYGLMRDGEHLPADRIAARFAEWSDGPLAGFLIDATARVLEAVDPDTGRPLVDLIVDRAGQKGTGRWTVIEALMLGQSVSTISAAVSARVWSSDSTLRERSAALTVTPKPKLSLSPAAMRDALLAGRILSHAQGFALMAAGSQDRDWGLDLARIAEIWRAGCIIRSALLDDLAIALRDGPPDGQLVLAPALRARLEAALPGLRQVVGGAVAAGLPVPSLAAALSFYDSQRQARGTANLIQGLRDFFGAHGFERVGATGTYHGDWT